MMGVYPNRSMRRASASRGPSFRPCTPHRVGIERFDISHSTLKQLLRPRRLVGSEATDFERRRIGWTASRRHAGIIAGAGKEVSRLSYPSGPPWATTDDSSAYSSAARMFPPCPGRVTVSPTGVYTTVVLQRCQVAAAAETRNDDDSAAEARASGRSAAFGPDSHAGTADSS